MTFNKITASLLLIALSTSAAAADIEFSGYGSFKGGVALDDDFYPQGFNYDKDISFKSESLISLQAKANFGDKLSATVVLNANGAEDFDVSARWAYLNYQYSPETVITLGRFALPYFRHSDTQDIGYSHAYARMPKAIYQGQEFDIIEGVRVAHSTYIGDGDLTLKGSYGAFDGGVDLPFGSTSMEVNNILQFSAEYSYEWFSVFAGVLTGEVSIDVAAQLDGALMMALPGYSVVNKEVYNPAQMAVYDMNELYAEDDRTVYYSLGFTAEHENWVFNGEYAAYNVDDSFFEESQSYYLSVGYVLDTWTFSLVNQQRKVDFEYASANSVDPYVNFFAQGMSDAFFKVDEYDANGIHVRYDATQGVAYKFEYTIVDGKSANKSTGIVTFGVDFVF